VTNASWESERDALLGRSISGLGLAIVGTRVERLVNQLYEELAAHGLAFRPPVYLSDEWGCPDGTPLIGVPFYLVDERLERIEAEMVGSVEDDHEAMRYLRHEAGHALNYAFAFYERPDWIETFGDFGRPYRERYRADPFSRAFVRHVLGWYAQKHPDEDFAETFAVWLTPGLDWRIEYDGWPALAKLEYVERLMREVGGQAPDPVAPSEDDVPVDAMHHTLGAHYASAAETMPIANPRQFDADLRRIFLAGADAPAAESAAAFIRRHFGEIVSRITYWTGEPASAVRSLIEHLIDRAGALKLAAGRVEAATLIELTVFGTAITMLHRASKLSRRRRHVTQAEAGR
jgi:hypothetical protein